MNTCLNVFFFILLIYAGLEIYFLFREITEAIHFRTRQASEKGRKGSWIWKHIQDYYKQSNRLILQSTIDPSGTFLHEFILLSGIAVVIYMSSSTSVRYGGLALLQITLFAVMLDLTFGLRPAMQSYFLKQDNFWKGRFIPSKDEKELEKQRRAAQSIEDDIKNITISRLVPYFLLRILLVTAVLILFYAIAYYQLILLDDKSFTGSNEKLNLGDMLYYSSSITSDVGSTISPAATLSKAFTAIQSFMNLFLFVMVVSLFMTLSEQEFIEQKQNLLNSLRQRTTHLHRESDGPRSM